MTHLHTSLQAGELRLTLVPASGKPPAIDEALLDQFDTVLSAAESEPPEVLIVQSAEPKYFCVGADIEALRRTTADNIRGWVELGHEMFNRLAALPCPTVARVEGYALGGGLELAMACDLIYASDTARFGQPEAKLGFVPGWGGCRRLPDRIGVAQAKRLFFTAAMISAREAATLRLADFVGTASELDEALAAFTRASRSCSRSAIAAFKRMSTAAQAEARQRNADAEAAASRACLLDPDTPRRMAAFLNRKKTPSA